MTMSKKIFLIVLASTGIGAVYYAIMFTQNQCVPSRKSQNPRIVNTSSTGQRSHETKINQALPKVKKPEISEKTSGVADDDNSIREKIRQYISNGDLSIAAQFLESVKSPIIWKFLIVELAEAYALHDVKGGEQWILKLKDADSDGYRKAMLPFLKLVARDDFDNAFLSAKFLSKPTDLNAAMDFVLLGLSANKPERAFNLIYGSDSVVAPERRAATLSLIFSELSALGKFDSVNKLASLPESRQALENSGAVSIVENWTRVSPESCVLFLRSLPDYYQINTAFAELTSNWVKQNPVAASQFVNTIQPSIRRDFAIGGLIKEIKLDHPLDALRWCGEIADSQYRKFAIEKIVPLLSRYTEEEIAVTLTGSKFSDSEKDILLPK